MCGVPATMWIGSVARGAHVPDDCVPWMASVPNQEMMASFSGGVSVTQISTPDASTAVGSLEL